MIETSRLSRRAGVGLAVTLVVAAGALAATFLLARVSQPGHYRGWSRPRYDEWQRSSVYITVRDSTRLAADIYRPARGGAAVEEPLPVLWKYERYHRAERHSGRLVTPVDDLARLRKFLRHGYVVAIVDARGSGASFGTRDGPFAPVEGLDAHDVTEWLAARAWCDGNVGMWGESYSGIVQYLATSTAPPHLKAIFPEKAMFDLYSFTRSGGVYRDDFARSWSRKIDLLDKATAGVPVDEDHDRSLVDAALVEHRGNRSPHDVFAPLPYRDSEDESGEAIFSTRSPASRARAVTASGIPVYHLAGWYDVWAKDALLWWANLGNPQKVIVGPWWHTDLSDFSRSSEQLRWFDHWLKGIENGIMDEAPIHYFTIGADHGREWRAADDWPPPAAQPRTFWLGEGRTGSIESTNDGTLRPTRAADGADEYVVDYTTTSGRSSRWTNAYGGPFGYRNMSGNDRKALTYTSDPLPVGLEVTGHPVVRIWITASIDDVDLVVTLEDVEPNGASRWVSEGVLRASHRALAEPPFDHLGLPYHRSESADVRSLPATPAELAFDLAPTSRFFAAGHRVRIAVTGADRDNLETTPIDPAPTLTVHRGGDFASSLTLPVVPAEAVHVLKVASPFETPAVVALILAVGGGALAFGLARRTGRRGR